MNACLALSVMIQAFAVQPWTTKYLGKISKMLSQVSAVTSLEIVNQGFATAEHVDKNKKVKKVSLFTIKACCSVLSSQL